MKIKLSWVWPHGGVESVYTGRYQPRKGTAQVLCNGPRLPYDAITVQRAGQAVTIQGGGFTESVGQVWTESKEELHVYFHAG